MGKSDMRTNTPWTERFSGSGICMFATIAMVVLCFGCGDKTVDFFKEQFQASPPSSIKEITIEYPGHGDVKGSFRIDENELLALCSHGNLERVPDGVVADLSKKWFMEITYKTTKSLLWPIINNTSNVCIFEDRRREEVVRYVAYVQGKAYYCRMHF